MSPTDKNQPLALLLALLAAGIFAVFEFVLDESLDHISIDLYLISRLAICLLIFIIVLYLTRGLTECHRLLFPRQPLPMIIWVRGLIALGYLFCLGVAFFLTKAQSFAYALFMLHPALQFISSRWVWGPQPWNNWSSVKPQLLPIGIMLFAVTMFALYSYEYLRCEESLSGQISFVCDINPDFAFDAFVSAKFFIALAVSLMAGIGFSLYNEYGNRLTSSSVGGYALNSLDVNIYTHVVIFKSLILVLVVGTPILYGLGLPALRWPSDTARGIFDIEVLYLLLIAYVVVTFGSWVFTQAFKRATKSAHIAAMDVMIFPVAALLDFIFGKMTNTQTGYYYLGGGLLLAIIGTVWCFQAQEGPPKGIKS